MLRSIPAGRLTVRGISLGGLYTCIGVPELQLAFDMGIAPRSFSGIKRLFLSHGHVDHSGALLTFLGIRALSGNRAPLRVYMPEEIGPIVEGMLKEASRFQRNELRIDAVPMKPGDRLQIDGGLWAEAFRTYHPVPSLGYKIFRSVDKLKEEFRRLPGKEIAARRSAGEILTEQVIRPEVAYATDTLSQVLDHEPELLSYPTLILESTFLDARRSVEEARARCHIHLDELLDMAARFQNDRLILMHFSQLYSPARVRKILEERTRDKFSCPVIPLLPESGDWPG